MRGQVLGVDARTGDGLVAGDDGRRYRFAPGDWAHRGEPAIGAQIDFEAVDDRARNIFPLIAASPVPPPATRPERRDNGRSSVVAALLAFFLGTFGIHRFYLGRIGSGILMLVLSLTVIGLLVTVPWALIDTVRLLLMNVDDFERRYPR